MKSRMCKSEEPTKISAIREAVKKRGGKWTPGRERITKILRDADSPLTVDQIVELASKTGRIDRVTVYRTLLFFEENQIVVRTPLADGTVRFELDSAETHHHHLLCRKCGKMAVLEACGGKDWMKLLETVKNMGFREVRHFVEFTGICADCGDVLRNRTKPRKKPASAGSSS